MNQTNSSFPQALASKIHTVWPEARSRAVQIFNALVAGGIREDFARDGATIYANVEHDAALGMRKSATTLPHTAWESSRLLGRQDDETLSGTERWNRIHRILREAGLVD